MASEPAEICDDRCYVALTHGYLNSQEIMDRVRSPQAGAIVLFAGTTRDNFAGKPVKELQYSAYSQLALKTMMSICKDILAKHGLKGIAMIHRLGTVPIGEESILIAVSAPHRQAAWKAAEEALEDCKERVEVWKREEFEGDHGVWRANRDGAQGQKVSDGPTDVQEHGTRFGPVLRPQRPGERGHGPVVHPKPPAQP
ncbi:Molybdopterin biosynthesis MoaE [Xylariaceae sp. FL0016]|nr:Molybdopterin biosynthesis MoaE [Xylariaceae sp. FL0016]